jgi:hypothetical protein
VSKYLLNKFLYTIDRDPDLVERYRQDPRGTVEWWAAERACEILNAARPERGTWLEFTPAEREALATHDYVRLFELGAHNFLLLTLFIASSATTPNRWASSGNSRRNSATGSCPTPIYPRKAGGPAGVRSGCLLWPLTPRAGSCRSLLSRLRLVVDHQVDRRLFRRRPAAVNPGIMRHKIVLAGRIFVLVPGHQAARARIGALIQQGPADLLFRGVLVRRDGLELVIADV